MRMPCDESSATTTTGTTYRDARYARDPSASCLLTPTATHLKRGMFCGTALTQWTGTLLPGQNQAWSIALADTRNSAALVWLANLGVGYHLVSTPSAAGHATRAAPRKAVALSSFSRRTGHPHAPDARITSRTRLFIPDETCVQPDRWGQKRPAHCSALGSTDRDGAKCA